LSADVAATVVDFYQNDEHSRQLPGKKDSVSISKNVHVQKRLILCNLKELYETFKTKNPNIKIGFSKFSQLRPKWCILAGAAGTHSVCVCTIHQNVDLMLEAIKINRKEVTTLISMMVCDRQNEDCMLRDCKKCPSPNSHLRKYLEDYMTNFESDQVAFSLWMSTDRTVLMPTWLKISEFIDFLIELVIFFIISPSKLFKF
jgi:hypothetical protein